MGNKVKYSAVVRILHSMIDQANNRLKTKGETLNVNLVANNRAFFNAVAAALVNQYGLSVEYADMCDAARLFLESQHPAHSKKATSYYVVQFRQIFKSGDRWHDIKGVVPGGIVPADPDDRWTWQEALDVLNKVNPTGKSIMFRIIEKWAEPV